jgi:hypothetical protein
MSVALTESADGRICAWGPGGRLVRERPPTSPERRAVGFGDRLTPAPDPPHP